MPFNVDPSILPNYLTPVVVTTGTSSTATSWQLLLIKLTTPAAYTVTLPANPKKGDQVAVRDCLQIAGSNPIHVVPQGTAKIENTTDMSIASAGAMATLMYDGTDWWLI